MKYIFVTTPIFYRFRIVICTIFHTEFAISKFGLAFRKFVCKIRNLDLYQAWGCTTGWPSCPVLGIFRILRIFHSHFRMKFGLKIMIHCNLADFAHLRRLFVEVNYTIGILIRFEVGANPFGIFALISVLAMSTRAVKSETVSRNFKYLGHSRLSKLFVRHCKI